MPDLNAMTIDDLKRLRTSKLPKILGRLPGAKADYDAISRELWRRGVRR